MNNTIANRLSPQHQPAESSAPPLPCRAQALGHRRRQGRVRLGRRRERRGRERRGVLLLLMLCLLVLFSALGVTYVLVGSQFRRSTAGPSRIEQYAVDYRSQLDDAAMQVFRGSSSPQSPLSIHSLLEDIYGNDGISSAATGTATSAGTSVTISSAKSAVSGGTNQQLVDLVLTGGTLAPSGALPWPLQGYFSGSPSATAAQPVPGSTPYNTVPASGVAPSGFFNGCVLTFTSGPAAGQSTRIVGYDNGSGVNTTTTPTLRVMDFPGAQAMVIAGAATPNAWQFVINGRPFNGTGFGFNTTPNASPGSLTFGLANAIDNTAAPASGHLFALLPNPVYFNNTNNSLYPAAGGIGGADEDYDAADWNNILLGLVRDPRDSGITPLASPHPPYPSLHRPELVQYWLTKLGQSNLQAATSSTANAQIMRQAMLRSIGGFSGADHPNFTGSNPGGTATPGVFDPVNGPWDVDNDGDSIADSVWIDLGSPAQTAPDGTTYKPLYAIRVIDMDGRLNANAHGNSAQAEATYALPITGYFSSNVSNPTSTTLPTALNPLTLNTSATNMVTTPAPNTVYPTVGSGYGTAEINLLPLFTQQTASLGAINLQRHQYGYLLGGSTPGTGPSFEGRYGESTHSASLPYTDAQAFTTNTTPAAYPTTFPPQAGVTDLATAVTNYANSGSTTPAGNPLAFVKFWDFPVAGYPTALTSYGSPADLWGRGLMALDINGTPLAPYMSNQPYVAAPTGGTYSIAITASTPAVTPPNPGSPTNPGGQYDTLNNPYTLNLSRSAVRGAKPTGATDNPFTPAELERLLRVYDADVSALAPRLSALLDSTSVTATTAGKPPLGTSIQLLRQQVTTDSFDLPSPSVASTTDLRTQTTALPLALSPADLLAARLLNGGVTAANIPTQLALMLPPDLINGQRFDINRPFGNGRDDDGDGVVDEPDEYGLNPSTGINYEPAWVVNTSATPPWSAGTNPTATPFPSEVTTSGGSSTNSPVPLAIDWNGDGTINSTDAVVARQQMARYLYVMAMTLVDQKLLTTQGVGTTGLIYDTDTANTNYQVQYALAQWAINAVDFRDRDSIMTPFEFDVNPFNGWQVDGDITTTADLDPSGPGQTVVWGCERPELLITETLAWHDRRTVDSPTIDGGKVGSGDLHGDFDQRMVPMPACFIELYNPWTSQTSTLNGGAPAAAEVSGEFYNTMAGGVPTSASGVVLNSFDPSGTSPVWRLIFTANAAADPDDSFPLNPTPFTQASIDRTVYFAQPPATSPDAIAGTLTYYTSQPVAPVKPGRYAVVGPSGENNGTQTYSSKVGRTVNANDTSADVANLRQIYMIPSVNTETNQVWVVNSGQTAANSTPPEPSPIFSANGTAPGSTTAGDAQPVVGVVVDQAATWSPGGGGPRSFGISDPQAGYSSYGPIFTFTTGERYFGPALVSPIDPPPLTTNVTIPAYRTAHLQRLANPQLRWNPAPTDPSFVGMYNSAYPVNPYRTVDSAFIDLTAFNGITPASAPNSPAAPTYRFCSNQRGDQYATGTAALTQMAQYLALWAHEPLRSPGTGVLQPLASDPTLSTQIYNVILRHSIGYLNQEYGVAEPGGIAPYTYTAAPGTAYAAATGAIGSPAAPAAAYAGMPTNPFPWLNWNNRPFISPMELALVPKSRSSRLMFDYCLTPSPPPASTATNALYTTQSVPPYSGGAAAPGYFGHLINFLGAQQPGAISPANLYRLLEYVQVPSKFVGTDTILDPMNFSAIGGAPAYTPSSKNQLNGEPAPGVPTGLPTNTTNSPYASTNTPYMNGTSAFWSYFRPPFDKVSEYRDPGRVNINTVQDPVVWNGVLNGAAYPELQTPVGGGTVASVSAALNLTSITAPGTSPSYFPNPFRSFAGAALTNSIYGPRATYPNSTNLLTTALRDIDVTLLRPAFNTTIGSWNQSMALFDAPSIAAGTTTMYPYNDPTRNPYFRLQNASRMSNLLTTRSNVYAVWITVGYFQVTPWYGPPPVTVPTTGPPPIVYDTAHPDGYQLGQELGNDSGQIKRHRAFYLFDRTIPVGFERGVDHNVQNAILLRRFIE